MRLYRALDLYIDGYLADKNRTKATRTKYREILDPFVAVFGSEALVTDPTREGCQLYLSRWADASASTRALHNSILRGFFRWLVEDEELIPASPMAKIPRPARPQAEDLDVKTVSGDEVQRLFAAATELDEFLTVALLAYLGPRRSAAAQLRWRDLDFEKGTVKFREKGGKVIVKPMPDELAEMLYQLALSGESPNAPDDYVIPNRTGRAHGVRWSGQREPRSSKVLWMTIKRVAARAGVDAHPHALRAAFACHYLDGHPGDLDALQKLLGHARPETTQVYLRRQDKFRAMERVKDLSWASVFRSSNGMPPAGFEPAFGPNPHDQTAAPKPIKAKLDELIAKLEADGAKARDRTG